MKEGQSRKTLWEGGVPTQHVLSQKKKKRQLLKKIAPKPRQPLEHIINRHRPGPGTKIPPYSSEDWRKTFHAGNSIPETKRKKHLKFNTKL